MRAAPFLGAIETRRQAGHFQFALMQATVPAHAVAEHGHADPHWVFAWDGDYQSRARALDTAAAATLVLNPPDTEHRDCFGERLGKFMAVSWSREDWQHLSEVLPLPKVPIQIPVALGLAQTLATGLSRSLQDLELESLSLRLLDRSLSEQRPLPGAAWLARAEAYLDAHPDCPDVRTLAGAVGVHPVSLARLLRQRCGVTPAQYLFRHRLQRACGWLRLSARSVTDIALDLGFADAAHFSHRFRRAYGVNPRAFRQDRR
ncbi:hypothetical protein C7S18_21885 [Ahniella affigens]|uniref:HTH araC/xylS-type domain-containing protein n=1 Tax=Ahniella affigens TaxID=2021234 RepID=A0A2P1PXU7_9GAMM|nr:AraC family transcriptional regulator [Ahniella affigens]AVP99662.1 hypothetical protein C7S18_21885 [Ahniella affigens]